MKRYKQLKAVVWRWLSQQIASTHGRILLCGLLVGLAYFPVWFGYLFQRALRGGSSWFLIATMLAWAFAEIWRNRRSFDQLNASDEDRLLGYALTLSGVVLFPFCRTALWSQALVWLIVMFGIACSSWGLSFFTRFKFPTVLIALTVYPRLGLVSRTVWEFFFPPNFLESLMAGMCAQAMRVIGWVAEANGRFVVFPEGAVEVGWGCNGLDMAIMMAIAGLFMGLLYKQTKVRIINLVLAAIVLALLANIPRLMLVSVAYVYWGEQWFNFWHGFWGGQIFASVLFTLYYYTVMGMMRRRTPSISR